MYLINSGVIGFRTDETIICEEKNEIMESVNDLIHDYRSSEGYNVLRQRVKIPRFFARKGSFTAALLNTPAGILAITVQRV